MAQTTKVNATRTTANPEPQDPLGRSLANQRTEKKMAFVLDKLKKWAEYHRASLPLGARDPIVNLIYQFVKEVPPTNLGPAGMAATGILLVSTFDSELFVAHEDLENYFGVTSARMVRYYNQVFGLFQEFVNKKTCGLSYGVRRRQILASTPLHNLKSIFNLEDPPNTVFIANDIGEQIHQLLPNNEYYLKKLEIPTPPLVGPTLWALYSSFV